MELMEKTMPYTPDGILSAGQQVTIFDANRPPFTLSLGDFLSDEITFGRGPENDIVLTSRLVTYDHGRFRKENDQWYIEDRAVVNGSPSTNGLIYQNTNIVQKAVRDGDFIRIDDGVEALAGGVLFVFSSSEAEDQWHSISTGERLTIGRSPACDITLPHISVSQNHAEITQEAGHFYLSDCGSTNGVILNGRPLREKTPLHEKDVIVITNSRLIFTSDAVYYCCYQGGISVDASDVVIVRQQRKHRFITCNHVDLEIRPRELVSIIGGSGTGKSTILNAMCGYLKPASGSVYLNGVDLYENFDSLKKLVGYVPQSDIVYDNLTLYDMLSYTARLRLPADTTEEEREQAISRAIATVELTEKRGSLIKNLSGGQRKRASIAVELLSDPNLLYLDEPASGLDPGTERNLMLSLRAMADSGKTVILVTHSTLQLKLCDKIVFMGRGGRLCFCGSYDAALDFFGVSDIVDIYQLITDHAEEWEEKFRSQNHPAAHQSASAAKSGPAKKENLFRQLGVLSRRYFKLIVNDRQRLILLLAQAPLLALLISFVASGEQFTQYEMTKSLLFALSCSAFWIGMLNAIQEICKERTILRREYMTGLRLDSYILSKIAVIGCLSAIQSFLVTGVFALFVGLPDTQVVLPAFLELFITTFLTALASTAMGLLVSCLFTNPDRAMTVAPLLLMPQILFSGLIFKLDGATEILSWFAVCRWSMEGYGTTADLNSLELRLQQEGIPILHEAEDFFTFSSAHLLTTWGILVLYLVAFLILARIALHSIKKSGND
ncbi:MAG: ATP-binding cassette domain-containing protein [Ruminococcaceae bacterium]|nr:ATP-binding cassette domain-containing protein [Oscillospiraceae bacterium]